MVLSTKDFPMPRKARETQNDTDFGYRRVPLGDKQAMVDDVFHAVAGRYDLMNDLMSGGLHRAWKEALVTAVNPPRKAVHRRLDENPDTSFAVLDLAGGTGDIAFRIADKARPGTQVTVADINAEMLSVGRNRAAKLHHDIEFIEANAEALPFPDKSFDAVTIAFGIRNVPRIDVALGEVHRVLKLGGHFLCLEFSSVNVPGLDRLYEMYSFNVIPALGRAVTGDAEAYRYLVESIRKFPKPQAFADMIRAAGLRRVTFTPMSGGIVALHSGWRL
jgi:demethylmenaquinone methyltransferase/2-methoxy-6-polyprenyl-1,4-benzoquinol methylase